MRHDLANFKSRLKALEAKVAEEGIILTEAQVTALERKKQDDEATGEIETAHPGYLGSQDTFDVGTLKGVGRVYQQTFVDTYSKVAFAKLYTTKTSMATCFRSLNNMTYRYCGFSRAEGLNTMAKRRATTINSPLHSMTLNTPKHR